MRIFTALIICGGVLLCGCNDDRELRGHGDAGAFILQHVRESGGPAIATNGLPALSGEWRHLHNASGEAVLVLFSASEYTNVAAFLHSAFGPPRDSGGRSIWHVGVYIYLDRIETNTEVDILSHL